MHVVVAGGGTAGHIEPALNTADAIRRRLPDATVSVLGTERGLEVELVPARGYELTLIPAVPLPRKPDSALLTLPARLNRAVAKVRSHLRATNASVLVGFGGYVALPAYFAARAEGVPIVVHEANARPGLANRIGARFATAVIETVAGSIPNAQLLGLPLRPAIADFNRADSRAAGLLRWGLDGERRTLLVFGGSQGARKLNEVVAAVAPRLVADGYQVLHSVGRKNEDHLRGDLDGYVTVPYIDDMAAAYAVADVALSRAGAMTVAELTAVGLPAIYVPLPIGNGEQRLNALPVVKAGGGVIVDDADLTAQTVIEQVAEWFSGDLASVSAAAASCGRPHASDAIVDIVIDAAGGRR